MKNNYKKLCLMLLLASTFTYAQQTILFDFGGVFSTARTTAAGTNYNNTEEDLYSTHVGEHSIADMINDTGANTGFSFEITSNFQYFNEGGTQVATGDAGFFHVDATKDSFFTQIGGEPNGEIKFSGLDNSKYYSFEIFSNRKTTANRTGLFTITGTGAPVTGEINPGGTTAEGNTTNTLKLNNIQPNGGEITIALENGTGNASNWAYMNAVKITESLTALSVRDEILKNGGVNAYPNPVKDILTIDYILTDSSETTISIYDINGRLIYNGKNAINQPGLYSYTWNRLNNEGARVTSGIYFLEFKSNVGKVTRKIILE